ncbi:MAG: hypothetical protein M0R80_07715 [Proteobacteria bacterium]|jgi:hypothetical protein|nr:hypothetical protein [Pseudomonadota bacterium]
MGDCRVEIRQGNNNVLLVAPHLEEDNTDFIAEYIAEQLDAHYVVNKGWERSNVVDYLNDKANCNDLDQLLGDDVVKDEFLLPIVRTANLVRRVSENFYVFIIHGFGAPATKNKSPDIVLGTGGPDRLSCKEWKRDVFAYLLGQKGVDIREGTGRFAGRARSNLNQFFKRKTDLWEKDSHIHSFQIEIEHQWRKDRVVARVMAEALYKSIEELLPHTQQPANFSYPMLQYS